MANVRKKKEDEKEKEFFSLRIPKPCDFDSTEEYEKQLLVIRKKRHDFQINRLKRNPSKMQCYDTMFFLSIWESVFRGDDHDYIMSFAYAKRAKEQYFKFIRLIKAKTYADRLKALGLSPNGLTKNDTPPTTITLETIRTSAAMFRRVGICA
jgi:hypothetical protein